jgi:hypothetical protein
MAIIGRKYGNKKVEEDGYTFDSKAEHREYRGLKLRLRAGLIEDLTVHPKFDLTVNGVKVGTYTADFSFRVVPIKALVVVDVKSRPTMTQVYRLKKKLVKAIHGVDIIEVMT